MKRKELSCRASNLRVQESKHKLVKILSQGKTIPQYLPCGASCILSVLSVRSIVSSNFHSQIIRLFFFNFQAQRISWVLPFPKCKNIFCSVFPLEASQPFRLPLLLQSPSTTSINILDKTTYTQMNQPALPGLCHVLQYTSVLRALDCSYDRSPFLLKSCN